MPETFEDWPVNDIEMVLLYKPRLSAHGFYDYSLFVNKAALPKRINIYDHYVAYNECESRWSFSRDRAMLCGCGLGCKTFVNVRAGACCERIDLDKISVLLKHGWSILGLFLKGSYIQ